MIQIIKPGSEVFLVHGEMRCLVLAVTISHKNMLRYNVAWWRDSTRFETWVEESELSLTQPVFAQVGFVTSHKGDDF